MREGVFICIETSTPVISTGIGRTPPEEDEAGDKTESPQRTNHETH
jgi:hypothetical protein